MAKEYKQTGKSKGAQNSRILTGPLANTSASSLIHSLISRPSSSPSVEATPKELSAEYIEKLDKAKADFDETAQELKNYYDKTAQKLEEHYKISLKETAQKLEEQLQASEIAREVLKEHCDALKEHRDALEEQRDALKEHRDALSAELQASEAARQALSAQLEEARRAVPQPAGEANQELPAQPAQQPAPQPAGSSHVNRVFSQRENNKREETKG